MENFGLSMIPELQEITSGAKWGKYYLNKESKTPEIDR